MSIKNDIEEVSNLPVVVYDNGGKTADRFTILNMKTKEVFAMSNNPLSPGGVNTFCGILGHNVSTHPASCGDLVPTRLLPVSVISAIARRYP